MKENKNEAKEQNNKNIYLKNFPRILYIKYILVLYRDLLDYVII